MIYRKSLKNNLKTSSRQLCGSTILETSLAKEVASTFHDLHFFSSKKSNKIKRMQHFDSLKKFPFIDVRYSSYKMGKIQKGYFSCPYIGTAGPHRTMLLVHCPIVGRIFTTITI